MLFADIPLWIWGAFLLLVAGLLALDLGVFHKTAKKMETKEALVWSAIWIALALVFNAGIFAFWDKIQPGSDYTNSDAGLAFLTGYLLEKALSVDNIFVFLLVFSYFAVPEKFYHRILFYGIIGALVFRAVFIALGVAVLEQFFWMMIVFGLFLVATGIKMLIIKDHKVEPENNPVVKLVKRFLPVTSDYVGQKFFTKIDGKLWATPMFLVLVVIEFTDVVFAVDSIPAILSVTKDPFLVFTSNVFAILGLRALFFALAGLVHMFRYLGTGLAVVLMFVGAKMVYGFVEKAVVPELPKFPVVLSLSVIVSVLTIAIFASILKSRKEAAT